MRSYAWVATQIGRPKAARAVGRVMARNPLPLLFPCHRVVDSSGDLHNYFYGLEMKARILEMEGLSRLDPLTGGERKCGANHSERSAVNCPTRRFAFQRK